MRISILQGKLPMFHNVQGIYRIVQHFDGDLKCLKDLVIQMKPCTLLAYCLKKDIAQRY